MTPFTVYVDGDATRLQQVVTNLVHNAIKFTPDHGRIALALRKAQDGIELDVSDTGQGIDRSLLPHVFDRFVQADSGTSRRHRC